MATPLAELFSQLNSIFNKAGASGWYVFGAQAAILYGAARLTADVDVTLLSENKSAGDLVSLLSQGGFDIRVDDVDDFIRRFRVLPVVHARTGLPVDIVFAGPGLEQEFLQRAVRHDIDGVSVPVASAEDLIAMKIFSGRGKDMEDTAAVIRAQGTKLDVQLIYSILGKLEYALDRSDLSPILTELLNK